MSKEQYIKAVLKRLKCTKGKKADIRKDLESDIAVALENGESMERIMERMGNPDTVAAEFNENFSDAEMKAAKKGKVTKVVCIILAVLAVIVLLAWYAFPKTYPIEKKGNYNQAEIVERAETVIDYFDKEDYAAIQEMCATESMAEVMTKEKLGDARSLFGEDWGELISFGNPYTAEIVQMRKSIGVVQLTATYENTSITYTISFDKEMKLSGFYMK